MDAAQHFSLGSLGRSRHGVDMNPWEESIFLSIPTQEQVHPSMTAIPHRQLLAPGLFALHLPEVLRLIFGYLSQNHLLWSISRVCRAWHTVCQDMIRVSARWDEAMGELDKDAVFKRTAPRAQTWHCTFGRWLASSPEISSCARTCLLESITKVNMHPEKPHRVETLVLEGITDHSLPLETFVSFRMLRSLRLDDFCMPELSLLGGVLEVFPGLEHLSATFTRKDMVQKCLWTEKSGPRTWESLPCLSTTYSGSQTATKLQSLHLESMSVDLATLSSFLERTPVLTKLSLALIDWAPSRPPAQTSPLTEGRFLEDLVGRYCPRLTFFEFSYPSMYPKHVTDTLAMTVLPQLTCFGMHSFALRQFIHPPLNPGVFKTLQPFMNHLTTIELTTPIGNPAYYSSPSSRSIQFSPSSALDAYLCQAPQLLHLKAKDVAFNLQCHYCPTTSKQRQSRYDITLPGNVWACRQLETLQLSFVTGASTTKASRSEIASRTVYAYIARVCPNLRELWIQHSDLRLDLESGLCYLGVGLVHLERLVIYTSANIYSKEIEWRDLFWMSSTQVSDRGYARWLQEMVILKGLKMSSESRVQWPLHAAFKGTPSIGQERLDILNEIHNAKRLMSVIRALEVLTDSSRGRCWDEIEQVWLQPNVVLEKRRRIMGLVKSLRPALSYQEVPVPFNRKLGI